MILTPNANHIPNKPERNLMPVLPKQLRSKQAVDDARSGGSFEVIPAGTYVVQLVKITIKPARSGTPRLTMELSVVEDTEGDNQYAKRRVFYASNIDDNGAPWLIRGFDAFGMDHDIDEEDFSDFYGDEVLATVSVGEFNGEATNDVKKLSAMKTVKPTDDDDDDPWGEE